MSPASVLSPEEKEHFLTHGWVKIPNAFTKEQAESITGNVWTRLGFDPNDKSTWTRLRTNMPHHNEFDASQFAPRARAAICELCGGEDKITPSSKYWKDSFIVNLGSAEGEGKPARPQDLDGWHVDGDFFVHYLDSPEQGLLVTPLYTDIMPHGGGTMICPEAIPKVAKHLHDHPEGVSPRYTPRGEANFKQETNLSWFNSVARSCDNFVEAAGNTGDVYLLHPLMLHSASDNSRRNVRIITNPPVSLREPFNFNRPDGNYTLVEQVTLRALGKDSLPDWKPTAPRESVVPERLKVQMKMKEDELRRLEELKKTQQASTQQISAPIEMS
ncbi:ribonucleoside-diphosphate reductase large subunit [Diplogelasinospora grovesii]|uniref:Ribonucleoside-diphosphate reductase large subunit n=1 Tax=Diplogelasinospora grovesii TaxID=303347 RepID=A0AAN6NC45_9PEZI|nr:ribonucleoside-diphosphate reductase large subunit [Diplogelasinospora grovesii]